MTKGSSNQTKVSRTLLMVSEDLIKRTKRLQEKANDIDQKLEHVIHTLADLRFHIKNSYSCFKNFKH